MQRRSFPCDPNRLRLLLKEQLQEKQQAEVESHLSDCAECQQTLEKLAADQLWWNELKQMNAGAGAVSANAEQPRTEEVATKCSPQGDANELAMNFLDASDDAGQLGRLGPFAITERWLNDATTMPFLSVKKSISA